MDGFIMLSDTPVALFSDLSETRSMEMSWITCTITQIPIKFPLWVTVPICVQTDDNSMQLHGISQGITYLHSMEPKLIHGDICGVRKIHISDGMRILHADRQIYLWAIMSSLRFQILALLFVVSDTQSTNYGTSSLIRGTSRWMVPVCLLLQMGMLKLITHPGALWYTALRRLPWWGWALCAYGT